MKTLPHAHKDGRHPRDSANCQGDVDMVGPRRTSSRSADWCCHFADQPGSFIFIE